MQYIMHHCILVAILACVYGNEYNYLQETVECKTHKEPCYQTGQCCEGYVCASYADTYGNIPEFPGQCIREKDEHFCQESSDCPDERECAKVGSLGGRPINMCVEKTESKRWYHRRPHANLNRIPPAILTSDNAAPPKFNQIIPENRPLRRGSACKDALKQCPEGMCCQKRRHFRSKPRYECQPIIRPTLCLRQQYIAKEVDDFRK